MSGDPSLFSCPRPCWFSDDLPFSWYAVNSTGYTLQRSSAKTESAEDSFIQLPRLQWVRERFWRYLSLEAVSGHRHLQERE